MRCYTIRCPPIRTHTVGYGKAELRFEGGLEKEILYLIVDRVGTPH